MGIQLVASALHLQEFCSATVLACYGWRSVGNGCHHTAVVVDPGVFSLSISLSHTLLVARAGAMSSIDCLFLAALCFHVF